MDFVEKLRGQRRFDSEKQLIEQIEGDCENAKSILKSFLC
jgi:FAD synthase